MKTAILKSNAKFWVLASVLSVAPLMGNPGLFSYDSALAEKGGNGGGSHGNNGNNGNRQSGDKGDATKGGKSASTGHGGRSIFRTTSGKSNALKVSLRTNEIPGRLHSKLGALNAAHASAQAFAHAAPNSRIGKIAAYYHANETADEATLALGVAQHNLQLVTALETAKANPALLDPASPDYQAAADELARAEAEITAAGLGGVTLEQATAAELAASQAADLAEADALTALNAAANKTPVDDETRAALDTLLVGKFPE